MSLIPPRPSYRDITPLESGGVIARSGFEFQDHVAVGYCIDMLQDGDLIEVWCETLDDITLIRCRGDREEFEFVQAKSNEFNYLWSVAELCKREKSKVGSSILEKSLNYEQGAEPCCFRVVTSLPVKDELKVLTLPLNSPYRTSPHKSFTELCSQVAKRIPDYKSLNGSDTSSWLSRVVWDVRHSVKAVENENIRNLTTIGAGLAIFLAPDQWEEMYKKFLCKVQEAGKARWAIDPEAKKLKRDEFLNWFKELAATAQHPGMAGKGKQLRGKMEEAKIPSDTIETAQELRMRYRKQTLTSGYMPLSSREDVEMKTQAQLNHLKSQLDAGQLSDTGIEFHARCLNLLSEIQKFYEDKEFYEGRVSLDFLQGYMYNLTDRCPHRFTRVII